ncbi:MAG: penicillin acylase family protein, partial [Acidimicrobiales bacterium]
AMAGPDPSRWRWGDHHRTSARHPLSGAPGVAESLPGGVPLDPPAAAMAGDNDTVQAAGYAWRPGVFDVTSCSVYRQVVDLSDIDHASFVVPGGASGDPTSPHAADQLAEWASHRRVPMLYRWQDVEADTEQIELLRPAATSG